MRFASLDAYISRPHVPVVPILSDRISLPDTGEAVDILDLLPPDVAARYAHPDPSLFLAPHERVRAPRVRTAASRPEWAALVRRLAARGMVEFTTQPRVVCGAHAVPKSDTTDRFIVDARPANTRFVESPEIKLPTPDLLARLVTDGRAGRQVHVAKVDLDNFYHRLRIPAWLRPYFALQSVRAGDVGLADRYGGADVVLHPCCATLPMGWSHSVYLAQMAHEHLLTTRTRLQPRDRITADTDARVDRMRHQVYIDDLNIIGADRAEVQSAQDEYVAAIRTAGLVVKQSKVVAPSAGGVECVGLELNGTEHTVGLSGPKLARLCADTHTLASQRVATGLDVAHIVGRWTWACLAARPALAVFNSVYRFVECARARRFALWRSVALELRTICALAPLLFADLAAEWFDRAVATDASSSGQGVVVARATEREISGVVDTDAVVAFAAERQWTPIVSSRWTRPEHINVLELRALTTAVRWVLTSARSQGARVFVLCDSRVVIGAATKGRSSSQPLLRRLRYLSALTLGSGVRLALSWVPTAHNPADECSRR